MEVIEVDERDSSWEDDRPRFRVYLHGSGETSTSGSTDTYDRGCPEFRGTSVAAR